MRDKGTLPAVCAGCRSPIRDQYILRVAPNLEWHAACLKCDECHVYLDESCTCFIRDGKPYCKRDFVRFGAKCHRCNQGFTSNDFVMRVRENIFHLSCFRCTMCTRQLLPGEEFALLPEGLVCGAHIKQFPPSTVQSEQTAPVNTRNTTSSSHVSSTSSSEQKTTRVRTVLNDRQLRILRTCYNNNPRPDALMKEQMTKLTGLSARVIRVWFQNKRCKDKKKAIAAAASDDMISTTVVDSPGDEKSKHVDVYMSSDSRDMLDNNEMEFSPLTTTLDFNSSSASTSPSLSNPGCENFNTLGGEHHMNNMNMGERNLWTLNTSDFIPPYTMPPASSLDFSMPCQRSDIKSDLALLAPEHPQV